MYLVKLTEINNLLSAKIKCVITVINIIFKDIDT